MRGVAGPEIWEGRYDYRQSTTDVNKLLVTNDDAERGVVLVQELDKLIAHNENQSDFLLQVVADYRRRYPDCLKSTLQAQTVL